MFPGFGRSKKNESPGEAAMNISKGADSSGNASSSVGVHGFDPSSLERAAKAAKELDRSKNASGALSIIQTQELTKQKELEAERSKYQVMQQELAIKKVQEEEQANRRNMELQAQQNKARSDYEDQLERKRMVEQLNAQKYMQDEERKKAEESLRRQEEIRRKTLEYEAELRQQTEMARVKAETEGRIRQERQNHDLILEKTSAEGQEYRKTVLDAISLATSTVGNGFQEFIMDREKLINTTVTLTAVAFGLYTARVSTGVVGRFVEARLGKPSLVRETTKRNFLQMFGSPITSAKLAFGSAQGENALKNIVLESKLDQRLRRVASSTANTKKNNAPFRHLLLYGPPGTGKTMFAKGLAKESGLHYAILTGGDVAPLGKEAVTEIHKLFDWAQTTRKGVLLFVDEADAFLRKRSTQHISEDLRNALNAFLYRTGEASQKFMVVYASNQPEQFDWAINDRIDDMIEFSLPEQAERLRMLSQYMDEYLLHPPHGSRQITVEGVDEEVLSDVASRIEGYSGREISKLAIAWQAAAYGTSDTVLTKELLYEVLDYSLRSKVKKRDWLSEGEVANLVKDSSVY